MTEELLRRLPVLTFNGARLRRLFLAMYIFSTPFGRALVKINDLMWLTNRLTSRNLFLMYVLADPFKECLYIFLFFAGEYRLAYLLATCVCRKVTFINRLHALVVSGRTSEVSN